MIPMLFWTITAFVFGIVIGSFLNVVIWRLPKNQSLMSPAHSYCPNCEKPLSALDLVPLLSFLALGRRCRQCHQPIAWRYFGVELLTGVVFAVLAFHFLPNIPDCLAILLFAAVLIPIFFIDLATFTIPVSLNLLAFVIPFVRDIYGIIEQEPNHALIGGWLPVSVLGGLIGALIFGVVRILGWLWKRVEAMGIGDVLLGRGMGAMLVCLVPAGLSPLRWFPIWVLLSVSSGAVIGIAALALRRPDAALSAAEETEAGETADGAEESSSLGSELMQVGWCFWFGDAWEYLHWRWALLQGLPVKMEPQEEEPFVPAPSAIPFGPFMVLGFFAAVFIGEWLTGSYLRWAFPPVVNP